MELRTCGHSDNIVILQTNKLLCKRENSMSDVWITKKGDEWRYERSGIQASADLNSVELLLSIRDVSFRGNVLSHGKLLRLLRDSKDYFSGVEIEIRVSDSSKQLENALEKLCKKGLIQVKNIEIQGNSGSRVFAIENKKWWSPW